MRHFAVCVRVVMLAGLLSVGCVSPFYGTARIEPGFHADAGLGFSRFINVDCEWMLDCIGPRADMELRYGFKNNFQVSSRFGLGFGYTSVPEYIPVSEGPYLQGDLALGIQYAYPLRNHTPAIRFEASYAPGLEMFIFTPTLLWGIGRNESVTLGVRPEIFSGAEGILLEVFSTIHVSPRWSIFLGLDLFSTFTEIGNGYPIASLGLGYTFGKLGGKDEGF
ncbi:hypothetical protein JXM67_04295 [candidate division WOR-3 bacterium]|nr:hypothetical protein [candidate division WOR-3 bacterium]